MPSGPTYKSLFASAISPNPNKRRRRHYETSLRHHHHRSYHHRSYHHRRRRYCYWPSSSTANRRSRNNNLPSPPWSTTWVSCTWPRRRRSWRWSRRRRRRRRSPAICRRQGLRKNCLRFVRKTNFWRCGRRRWILWRYRGTLCDSHLQPLLCNRNTNRSVDRRHAANHLHRHH